MGQFGDVIAALQQPRVDLRVRATVTGQQRLEDGLDAGLAGRGGQPTGEAIADAPPVQRTRAPGTRLGRCRRL